MKTGPQLEGPYGKSISTEGANDPWHSGSVEMEVMSLAVNWSC
jgi:hypothetical protein